MNLIQTLETYSNWREPTFKPSIVRLIITCIRWDRDR